MSIESAFSTALSYERRIRDLYLEAARDAFIPEAKAFYEILARDEGSHAAYLEHALTEWRNTGAVSGAAVPNALPPPAALGAAIAKAKASFTVIAEGGKPGALANALKAEEETSAFYRSMIGQLPEGAKEVFARLMEIEDGHTAIVRAELDLVSATGHWFDIREFGMEE